MRLQATVAIVLACGWSASTAQVAPAGEWVMPRTVDGEPDFTGVYERNRLTWISGEEALSRAAGAGAATPRAGRAPLPPTEPAPYQAWAAERVKQFTPADYPGARCLLPGVPAIMTQPFPLQIVQTPGQVVILHEAFHAFRIIPTDGRPHSADPDPTFMGEPVGHWEGDVLVVDTIGFNDKTWLAGPGGSFHTEQLHVVERFRLLEDGLEYEAIQEDPGVLTKPWTIRVRLNRAPLGTTIGEYECAENNRDLPHLR